VTKQGHLNILDAVCHTMPNRARVHLVGDFHSGLETLHKNRHCRKEMELNAARTQVHPITQWKPRPQVRVTAQNFNQSCILDMWLK
jgi:predicted deacylase